MNPVISVTQASMVLGGHQVLYEVNFNLYPGECLAIMGPNGSGKSTLMRAVCGLVPLQAGTITLFGEPRSTFTDWGRVGWVPQQPDPGLDLGTVQEVVATGRIVHRRIGRRLTPVDRDAIALAMTQTGIQDLANRCFGRLSGGQRQRVLIARALATQPELLLLDEPMTGVDVTSQQAIVRTLEHLNATGVTIALILHEVDIFTQVLTRELHLANGQIVADHPHQPAAARIQPGE